MECIIPGQGVRRLFLHVSRISCAIVGHGPHAHIRFIEARILHVIDVHHLDGGRNAAAVCRLALNLIGIRGIYVHGRKGIGIPGDFHAILDGRVIVVYVNGLWHVQRHANPAFDIHFLEFHHLERRIGAVFQPFEYV